MRTKIFSALAVLPFLVGCSAPEPSPLSSSANLLQVADELRELQLFDSSLATYQKAITVFDSLEQSNEKLECLVGMANCWWALHKSDSAVALCQQAVKQFDLSSTKAPRALAEAVTILGNVHADKRTRLDFVKALAYYQKALEILQSNGVSEEDLVMARERFGIANWLIGNYEEAERWYRQCIRELPGLSKTTAANHAILYSRLSSVLESMGRLREAAQNANKAYEISKAYQLASKVDEAEFLLKIGRIELALGDPGQALVSYEAALYLQTEFGEKQNKLTSFILSGLADCNCRLGEEAKAMSYFQQARKYWNENENDDGNGLQVLLRQMAKCHLRNNRPAMALTLQREALKIIERKFGSHSISWMYAIEEMGRSRLLAKDYDGAIADFERAKRAAKELLAIQHPKHLEFSLQLAEAALKKGDLKACQNRLASIAGSPQLDRVLEVSLILNLKYQQLHGSLDQAMYEAKGDYHYLVKALHHYQNGINRVQASQRQFISVVSELHLQQTVTRLCETALECCILLQHKAPSEVTPDLVLAFIEAASNVLLKGAYNNQIALTNPSIPKEKADQLRELEQQCEYYYHRISAPPEEGTIAGGEEKNWQLSFLESSRKLKNLQLELAANYPAYKAQIESDIAPSLQRIIEALPEGATFMAFVEGKENLYRFRCNGRGSRFEQLAAVRDYTPMLDSLLSLIYTSPPRWQSDIDKQVRFKQFCRQAHRLHELLIGQPLPGDGKLVVALSGHLNYLPMEILLENEPDETMEMSNNWRALPYLFKSHTVQMVESAGLWLSPHTEHSFASAYAGFAPNFDNANGGMVPLKYNISEVQQSAAIWSGLSFTEGNASIENFRKVAGSCAVLHLATHATCNSNYPASSKVFFSNTQYISGWEIASYHIPVSLVVLSACNTGGGKLVAGDGVHSLSRAFRQSGAAATLMSLWVENDVSGNELLIPFMKNLKEGLPKSEALQKARMEFLTNTRNERMTHPHYWANLVLIGNDTPLNEQQIRAATGIRSEWIILSAGLVAVLLWIWKYLSA